MAQTTEQKKAKRTIDVNGPWYHSNK